MATERRVERLQKEILRELSKILREEISDPRMGMISLTGVKLTPDLKIAKVSVSALGGEAEWRRSYGAILHALGFIRQKLGRRLAIRTYPELHFVYDKSIEKAARIHEIIGGLAKERTERGDAAEAPLEPEEAPAAEPGGEEE
jgi:ribosome-binding factor A